MSEVGFEPTPSYEDQNTYIPRLTVVRLITLSLAP